MTSLAIGAAAACLSLAWSCAGTFAQGEDGRCVVYDEGEQAAGRDFVASGWMPDGNGISYQDHWREKAHSGESCIRFGYDPKANPWVGVYFLANDDWKGPGIDLLARLGITKGQPVQLSFWARSDDSAWAEFKVGGVSDGNDSIPFARTTGYIQLTPEWKQYTIDLSQDSLRNVVGGFCMVTSAARNRGKDAVWFYVDDVEFVAPGAGPGRPPWESVLRTTRWVAYSPTELDPTAQPPRRATAEGIRSDLRLLAPYFDGVVTYGCTNGLEEVPAIARELGFKVIQGVWSPSSREELSHVRRLADQGLLTACIIGNEGFDEPRYDWEQLRTALREVREQARLPVSTSEQVADYGDRRLVDEVDFLAPNCHALWNNIRDVSGMVAWTAERVKALEAEAGGKVVLVKEVGLPSGGDPAFTEQSQAEFWEAFLKEAKRRNITFVAFEAVDAPWKHEQFSAGDIGPHWGLLRSNGEPKTAIRLFVIK